MEQCYQAQKFICPKVRMQLQRMKKHGGENDSSYGMRVWRAGQGNREVRPDWNAVKVEMMRRVNLAKYLQHSDLQADLLATGDVVIAGAPSTSWTNKAGKHVGWSLWNGLIQMRIREDLRPGAERSSERRSLLEQRREEQVVGGPHVQEREEIQALAALRCGVNGVSSVLAARGHPGLLPLMVQNPDKPGEVML